MKTHRWRTIVSKTTKLNAYNKKAVINYVKECKNNGSKTTSVKRIKEILREKGVLCK